MTGKISRLPRHIRDQLHRLLEDGQTEPTILDWLNSLPEVRAVLDADFNGELISPQNLSEYRKRGFRRWLLRQSAADFVADDPEDACPPPLRSSGPVIDRLVHWVSVRFAAAAHDHPASEDPQTEFRELRALVADIVALRRGELISRRIALEQQRQDLAGSNARQQLEQLFWEWTRRPDIRAKLFPDHDPDQLRRDVVTLLDHKLLGTRNTFAHVLEPDPDPACCI